MFSSIDKEQLIRFGKNLKKVRTSLGISQTELSFLIQSHRNFIGRLERGEQNPSLLILKKLSKALKVEVDLLIK